MTSVSATAAELRWRASWLRTCPALARAELERSGWTGAAATALAAELERIGADLVAAADQHDRAAAALDLVAASNPPAAGGGSW